MDSDVPERKLELEMNYQVSARFPDRNTGFLPNRLNLITRKARNVIAAFAATALMFGGTIVFASSAHAAPGDPVLFADESFEDAVNAALGQNPGDTITEAQAASITQLNASNKGIVNLGGIEYLTQLENLILESNNIVDISPLSGLTNLNLLYLSYNKVADISTLSGLSNLSTLALTKNNIHDLSPLSQLTALTHLYLSNNKIIDASALSALENLIELKLANQSYELPDVSQGQPTANPVVDVSGSTVAVTSTDASFTYDASLDEWSFATVGNKNLTWNTSISLSNDSAAEFSGSISQSVTELPPAVAAVAQDPTIVQAECIDGEVINPIVQLPTSEGIDYSIQSEITPGETVTVVATATTGYYVTADPESDWQVESDGLFATIEIPLDSVECFTPPADEGESPDIPVIDDGSTVDESTQEDKVGFNDSAEIISSKPDGTELAKTGTDLPLPVFGGTLGALLLVVGLTFAVLHRRNTTQ